MGDDGREMRIGSNELTPGILVPGLEEMNPFHLIHDECKCSTRGVAATGVDASEAECST